MRKKIIAFFHSRLFQTASLSLISVILVRAINLISIPIFSRLLTTVEYGTVDIFFSYANIFMIILGLDTHGAVAKARLDFRDDPDTYMATNLIFTAGFACAIAVVVNVLYVWLQGLIGLSRIETNLVLVYGYSLYLIAFRTAENNFDFQFKKNIVMSGTVSLLNVAVSIILILTVFNRDRQSGRIIGASVPTAICAFIIWFMICQRGKWRYNRTHIRYALKFGVPLVPHNLSHIILSSADRIMIKAMISASAAGIYSLSYTLGMLIMVVSEGMNQAFAPWLFRKIDSGKIGDVTKAQRLYLMVYVVICIAVMTISPEIVKIIGPRDYWDGTRFVMWVVYAVFLNFTYTLYVNIEFFYLKSNWISTGTIAAAIVNCVLNSFFLKKVGYQFGAYSTVISYAALLLFHMIIVNCVLKKNYTDNRFVVLVVLSLFFVTFGMNVFSENLYPRLLIGVAAEIVAIGAIYVIYRKQGKIDFSLKEENEEHEAEASEI